jgi:hypothetical protein
MLKRRCIRAEFAVMALIGSGARGSEGQNQAAGAAENGGVDAFESDACDSAFFASERASSEDGQTDRFSRLNGQCGGCRAERFDLTNRSC